MTTKLNFIDLFCGAGGFSVGLTQAGFTPVLGVDFDSYAIESFALNHPSSKTFCGDIKNLTASKLHKLLGDTPITLIAGGPPCQGFSTMGEGDPNDPKNALFKQYLRILKVIRPKFILFENVTGILASKNAKVLDSIIKAFQKAGYFIDIKVLEAQKYGVPQKRKRTIIMGSSITTNIKFPKPIFDTVVNGTYIPPRTLGEALDSIPKNALDHKKSKTSLKDLSIIKHIPEGAGIRYERDEKKYLPFSLGIDWENLRERRLRQTRFFRPSRSKPSPTIDTHNYFNFHPTENRKFTIRELATIQSFPLNFIFAGKKRNQLTQIGNAVPPKLAKELGLSIKKMLNLKNKSKSLSVFDTESLRKQAFRYDL